MRTIFTFFLIAVIFSLNACKQDEQLVDYTEDKALILAIAEASPNKIQLMDVKTGKVESADIYESNNAEALPSDIDNIVRYGNSYYIFLPESNKIEIMNTETFENTATIDFSTEQLEPIDICFPNATTAYICARNSNEIFIWDIKNNLPGGSIEVGNKPCSIDYSGNLVFVANQDDNTVSVIYTGTNEVVDSIDVAPVPAFIESSYNGERVIVVSLGNGKIDEETPSDAYITVIDVASRTLEKTFPVGNSVYSAKNEIPVAMALNSDRTLFISSEDHYYYFNIDYGHRVTFITQADYNSLRYDYKKDMLMILSGENEAQSLIIADVNTGRTKSSVKPQLVLKDFFVY